ncbi:hypothetical protein PN36_18275 [Candidatus Thiomargarita nelsonii]|uniref:CHAT domain-containing protein n=1 Tax=Candidatus Thiomargarita nelsonii TaxID=1003181 RepID=A0A0A6RP96_9GAMM|nr:hypothetical protein PN36_18275 [Candidatus Thiomargarita nelsonii]
MKSIFFVGVKLFFILTLTLVFSQSGFSEEPLELAKTYNSQAVQYYQQGEFKKALQLAEKALKITTEILGEKHPDSITSLNNLGIFHVKVGKFDEALQLFEKGYHISKEVFGKKHSQTLTNMMFLAGIYSELSQFSAALLWSEKAYPLFKEVFGEKHLQTLTIINNLARSYKGLGRLSVALPWFEKAYQFSKEGLGEKHPQTIMSLSNLGIIYNDLGRLSAALPLLEKAYHLSNEVLGEKDDDTLSRLNNLAGIYYDLGRLSAALPLFEKAYHLSKELLGEKHPQTLSILNNFGIIHRDLNLFNEALPLVEKAYHLSEEVLGEKHPDTLRSLLNLALIYNNLKGFSVALPLYEKGYRLFKETLGEKHPDTLLCLSNLAYIYQIQGDFNQAIKHFEKLVEGVEHLRSGDFSAENRQALFKKWVQGYFDLSDLYIVQSRLVDAFRLAEMSKARTLLESIAAKFAAQQSGLTATEQQQLRDFEARLAFLNNRIAKANRLEEKITLETEKNQLVFKLNQFHHELMAKYPKYAQLSEVQIIGAKEGAKFLPADAVLISYLVNENKVLAFTLESDGTFTAHDLGKIPSLKKDIETYHHRLTSSHRATRGRIVPFFGKPPEIQKNDALSLKLGKVLLEPLADIIKDKSHWIISPSGALALIPFETLRLEGEKQPVIVQHQISYVQSLSILAQLQKRNQVYNRLKNRGTLLAMGAPLYEKTTSNPNYSGALRQLNLKWKNLPGALDELSQLEKLFKETKPRIYKQAQATEANLQRLNQQGLLAQYRYLVFSAHGYLSDEVPALSSIVLGQVNNPAGIDGYVTAGEWTGYNLKSDLMVLSACQTGLGEVVGGEGVMGLPYALYVAGNKNTLLTLWAISDEVTAEFITRFFRKLKAGVGQVKALTATKREFLKRGGDYSNPMYWAAFVLYGIK